MTLALMAPRSDRGTRARKPFNILFSDDEKALLEQALETENANREAGGDVPLAMGTRIRLLALTWARSVARPIESEPKRPRK